MATNLAISDELLNEAKALSSHRTKKAVVTEALIEYIQHHKQQTILECFGHIDYDSKHDYKTQRLKK